MKTDKLYPLTEEDLPRAIEILTKCFHEDPLYQKLIPEEAVRERALPELFECDIEEMAAMCDVLADSPELNGLVIVDDETEDYNSLVAYSTETFYALKTDALLIREDLSLKTLWNFFIGRSYLNSEWVDELEDDQRIHIIYLAVSPEQQGKGIAGKLIREVIQYARKNDLLITLETHNPANVTLYEHYGFTLYKVLESHFDLKQYCMVRWRDPSDFGRAPEEDEEEEDETFLEYLDNLLTDRSSEAFW